MIQTSTICDRIYEALTENGPLTRAEISRITGLNSDQISRILSKSLQNGQVQIEDGRVVLVEEGVFGSRIEASSRGPGNIIFQVCKRNWRGYHIHQLFSSTRRASA